MLLIIAMGTPVWAQPAPIQEPVDYDMVEQIRAEGLERSEVMETLSWLTDVHGPRLTGSPALDKASAWIVDQLKAWGMDSVHLEPWGPFGQGWTLNRFSLHVDGAISFPVHAYPKAWSPSVSTTAEVVIFAPETADDFAKYEGKLAGKIVLVDTPRELDEPFEPYATRRDADNLLGLANWAGADERNFNSNRSRVSRFRLQQQAMQFLHEEGPALILDRYFKGDYGTIFVSGASVPAPTNASSQDRPRPWDPKGATVIPQVTVAVEHYNRIYRVLEKGLPLTVEVNLDATFNDEDPMEYNVIGEIAGTDPALKDEVVMLGAHLDSWHAGTGSTDNGAGSAVMIEAMRILKTIYAAEGIAPRRTIRMALWTGEEQGLHGSRAYVNDHFATIPGWGMAPTEVKPEHAKFSAYYNMDNGTGKIRGVYLQGNEGVAPIFRAWMRPFHDLGAGTLTLSNTGGTDHLAFDMAGLPGFQFIQEPIAYSTRTHHSNMDVWDHAIADDLKQAATIIASFVHHTAQRDERLPRKPMPGSSNNRGSGSGR